MIGPNKVTIVMIKKKIAIGVVKNVFIAPPDINNALLK